MIIENLQKSDIQTIGDIKQIKASIDVKNIEFITTLLSSNLYSQPVKSFMREIVSNAWDSHVEAGNTKEPVIIKIEADKVSIRDYGTGLSQEDFEELYCKIGSSSKRDSNAYIGAFGLGHLSPLAVSDVVYITSYYNHIARSYVMIKENGTITTNYLGCSNTDEYNGLLVSVPMNHSNINKAKESLVSLAFFPNLYIDCKIDLESRYNINQAKVVRYKNFSVCNLLRTINYYDNSAIWILLGNVLYPLESHKLNINASYDEIKELKGCNICLNVNIGDINVTPNRESIIYSENTIKVLSNKLDETIKEINSIVDGLSIKDIKDIVEYSNLLKSTYWNPLENTITNEWKGNYKCEVTNPYKGKRRSSDFNDAVKCFAEYIVPGFKCIKTSDKFVSDKGLGWRWRDFSKCNKDKFIAIEDNKNISGYIRKYIEESYIYWNKPIITSLSLEEFTKNLCSHGIYYTPSKDGLSDDRKEAIKEWYDHIVNHTTIITSQEIEDYKAECKAGNGTGYKKVDNSLYALFRYDVISYPCSTSDKILAQVKFPDIIDRLKKSGKCILHNGREVLSAEQANEYKLLEAFGYTIYWASNKLYDKIIKYKANLPDKARILSNVVIDYKSVLDNPTKQMECAMVMSNFCNTKVENAPELTYLKSHVSTIDNLLPNYDEFKVYFDHAKIHACSLSTLYHNSYYDNYKLKHSTAIWLKEYIDNITPILLKNWSYSSLLSYKAFITGKTRDTLAKYLTAKYCIKNKIPINIKSYLTLKRNELIKILYE